MDGKTKLQHTLDETFGQITKSNKHKLSPIEENGCKKVKVDENATKDIEPLNPIGVLNNKITEKTENLNCEDLSSNLVLDSRTFCGLTVNSNMPLDVIEKCDRLGKHLANALIDKGALDVMKVSQDYIRNSTIKKVS